MSDRTRSTEGPTSSSKTVVWETRGSFLNPKISALPRHSGAAGKGLGECCRNILALRERPLWLEKDVQGRVKRVPSSASSSLRSISKRRSETRDSKESSEDNSEKSECGRAQLRQGGAFNILQICPGVKIPEISNGAKKLWHTQVTDVTDQSPPHPRGLILKVNLAVTSAHPQACPGG